MSDFLEKSSWKNIDRGYIFDAAVFYPSDTKRPLTFFVPDEDDATNGTLVSSVGDFRPKRINGRWQAVEQQVVVTLKPRKVVVLSHNEINHSEDFEYILIAPIMSIYDTDKAKNWYGKMVAEEHPFFLYLPDSITGRECYVDLSELTSVHKGMLLNKHNEIPESRMNVLQELLSECLDLGLVKEDANEDTGTDN